MLSLLSRWYWSLQYWFLLRFSYVRTLEDRFDVQCIEFEKLIEDYDALSQYIGEQGAKYSFVLRKLAADVERQREEYQAVMPYGHVGIAQERYGVKPIPWEDVRP